MKRNKQAGFSLIELLIVVAIILIIAAIAVPNLLKAKDSANQSATAANLRTLNTSLVLFQSSYGGFPASGNFTALGDGGTATACPPPATGAVVTAACLIDSGVENATSGANAKDGYYFTYTATGSVPACTTCTPPTPAGLGTAYTITATPVGATNTMYYYTDQTLSIRKLQGSAPTATTGNPI